MVNFLKSAWFGLNSRNAEHIEIIDTADPSQLFKRWRLFTPTGHYHLKKSFDKSRIARWPRRTCESLYYPMLEATPCEEFHIPRTTDLSALQKFMAEIAQYE